MASPFRQTTPACEVVAWQAWCAFQRLSVLYLLFVFVMDYFPLTKAVTPKTMNWVWHTNSNNNALSELLIVCLSQQGIAFFGGVAVLASINYAIYARKVFEGPVCDVREVYT